MSLRVSVATFNRVLLPDPQNGTQMLALERRATVMDERGEGVRVRAQPFGGAVRILDPAPLQTLLGAIEFDSGRSQREGDFRILISPSKWEAVRQFCLQHLENPDDTVLESLPQRELVEEFGETLHVNLGPGQYTVGPVGFVVENNPRPTDHLFARGQRTARVYRIYEVRIVDRSLCQAMLAASQRYSDRELEALARSDFQSGGRGCASTVLVLPLEAVRASYLAVPLERRFQAIPVAGHLLDESVLAVLPDIDVAQYQRQEPDI